MDTKEMKDKVNVLKIDAQKVAEKEIIKAKKELEKVAKQVEAYVKKNPQQAAVISAGIGAALGAAVAVLLGKSGSKEHNKK